MATIELGRGFDGLLYYAEVPFGLQDIRVRAAWQDAMSSPRDVGEIAARMTLDLGDWTVHWQNHETEQIAPGIGGYVRSILLTIERAD